MGGKKKLFEQDAEEEVRLPWPLICGLAVKARIRGVSMNDVIEQAIAIQLAKPEKLTTKPRAR